MLDNLVKIHKLVKHDKSFSKSDFFHLDEHTILIVDMTKGLPEHLDNNQKHERIFKYVIKSK